MDYQEYLCLENIVDLMACKAWLTEKEYIEMCLQI